MTTGDKFNSLSNAIQGLQENTSYRLNANGVEMIKKYHSIINEIEKTIFPIVKNITKDASTVAKQCAIHVVSSINSNDQGTEEFDIMGRLDTLTNGGQTEIAGESFVFNPQDNILNYLEKV
jgi:hypothetical protein